MFYLFKILSEEKNYVLVFFTWKIKIKVEQFFDFDK